ncbi:hypothetical protein PT974_08597 [Cladobotryum mycophilum]|uniref:Uncharacterized protein n=1 Tax=Cladobotryum mycophilum TaxID=491253 RepID=A0ABR0SEV1_9HYPO
MALGRGPLLGSLFAIAFVAFLSAVLLSYTSSFHSFHPDSHVLVPRNSSDESGEFRYSNLTKRLSRPYDYYVKKGKGLYCEMRDRRSNNAAKHYLQTNEITGWPELFSETEGWFDIGREPGIDNYLDPVFDSLGVGRSFISRWWSNETPGIIFPDPSEPDLDNVPPSTGFVSGAFFASAFIPKKGVIIAGENLAVSAAVQRSEGKPDAAHRVTNLKQIEVCKEEGASSGNVNYIIRASIANLESLEIIFMALRQAFPGPDPVIGTWGNHLTLLPSRRTRDPFYAIIGSPNGSGSAYFLTQHKDGLGNTKSINKIDVFAMAHSYTVSGTTPDDSSELAKIALLFHIVD